LTTDGVVPVKFRKEYFALFDKRISQRKEDGTKKIVESSWFKRGEKILVSGIRRGNEFVAKKYASGGLEHQLYRIDSIDAEGNLELRSERYKGEEEQDDD
jgi:DNA polymerase-3 subunit alpha